MATLITGNTYQVKDQLKSMGGRWDPIAKGWKVPDEKADEARALVGGAPGPKSSTGKRRSRGTWTGCSCGSVEEYSRPSDCASCEHDR